MLRYTMDVVIFRYCFPFLSDLGEGKVHGDRAWTNGQPETSKLRIPENQWQNSSHRSK